MISIQTSRKLLLFFIFALLFSGLTAIPVEWELMHLLCFLPRNSGAYQWIETVLNGYRDMGIWAPFLLYGYDWLAFAHFVLALLFVGPYKDPVRNIWVIRFGLYACLLVIPFAFVAGSFRSIPFWWQLIDCSFGVFGYLLLRLVYRPVKAAADASNWTTQF